MGQMGLLSCGESNPSKTMEKSDIKLQHDVHMCTLFGVDVDSLATVIATSFREGKL